MIWMRATCILSLVSTVFCNCPLEGTSSSCQQVFSSTVASSKANLECDAHISNNIVVTELSDRVIIMDGKSALNVELKMSDSKIRIHKNNKTSKKIVGKTFSSHGILGIYKMPTGYHIGLIMNSTHRECCIPNLYQITDIKLLRVPTSVPIAEASEHLSAKVLAIEQAEAEHLFFSTFRRHSFYYCNGEYDITRSFQSNYRDAKVSPSNDQADSRFFWNLNNVKVLLEANCSEFVVPVTSAWISNRKDIMFNGIDMQLTLISRRSRYRQGPRYIKRGSDSDGNVANFVETEQVVGRVDGKANSSFIQIRGSIPLLWSQLERWRLKPKIKADEDMPSQLDVLRLHLSNIAQHYGNSDGEKTFLYFVNLIDKKGSQGLLGRFLYAALAASVSNSEAINVDASIVAALKDRNAVLSQVFRSNLSSNRSHSNGAESSVKSKYIWFDYHHHCSGGATEAKLRMIYEELKEVIDSEDTSKGAYFLRKTLNQPEQSSASVSKQKHLIRTNCIDCLDRTNVVQASISKWVLIKQLLALQSSDELARLELSSSPHSEILEQIQLFEQLLRELWAENGDNLSLLYAGTKAMKRDVTQFGKRTTKGKLDDGMAFAKRYVINNCQDFTRQKGLDLIIGMDSNNKR